MIAQQEAGMPTMPERVAVVETRVANLEQDLVQGLARVEKKIDKLLGGSDEGGPPHRTGKGDLLSAANLANAAKVATAIGMLASALAAGYYANDGVGKSAGASEEPAPAHAEPSP